MKFKHLLLSVPLFCILSISSANVYTVFNNSDISAGSLSDMIGQANSNPGPDTIFFNIASSSVAGRTIVISSALPAITESLVIDATTQSMGSPFGVSDAKIILDGGASVVDGIVSSAGSLEIFGMFVKGFTGSAIKISDSPGNPVLIGSPGKGNVISGNPGNGIRVERSFTTIKSNLIGVDTNGTASLANNHGIMNQSVNIDHITIGGPGAQDVNVISGNNMNGIWMEADTSIVQGNLVGTDNTGLNSRGNLGVGIYLNGNANSIGGPSAPDRNIVSGNGSDGIQIVGSDNKVQGNYVGLDKNGVNVISNIGRGIYAFVSGMKNLIGGGIAGEGNVVCGNGADGIGTTLDSTFILGNYVGLLPTGTDTIGNVGYGISISSTADGCIVGGNQAGDRNVVSGNDIGIFVFGHSAVVRGNYVGTDASGTAPLGNLKEGIKTSTTAGETTIGGPGSGDGNLISGNTQTGLHVAGDSSKIFGNLIGTNASGTGVLGNGWNGVYIAGNNITVGGPSSGERNVISGNSTTGIWLAGDSCHISGNFIGTDINGNVDLGNTQEGILVLSGFTRDSIFGNVISGNGSYGISSSGTYLAVHGNKIGLDVTGSSAIGNDGDGIWVSGNNCVIGDTAGIGRNYISSNSDGIRITGDSTRVINNFIGTDVSGTIKLGNTSNGIDLDASYCLIGGPGPGYGNVISDNGNKGIRASGNRNIINSNLIGTDPMGTVVLGNGAGIELHTSVVADSIINNIISGNNGDGIDFAGNVDSCVVQGNFIGTNPTLNDLTNVGVGVRVELTARNNLIGDSIGNKGNWIGFNHQEGVFVSGANAIGTTIIKNHMFGNSENSGAGGIFLSNSGNNSKTNPVVDPSSTKFISGTADPNDRIDIYSDTSANVEGNNFIQTAVADGAGDWLAIGDFPIDVAITATSVAGNTSMFEGVTLSGPKLTNTAPNRGTPGRLYTVTVTGASTNFTQADGTGVSIYQAQLFNADSVIPGTNFNISNDLSFTVDFAIPCHADTGHWSLRVVAFVDDSLQMDSAFKIENPVMVDAGPDQTICGGDSVTLGATLAVGGTPPYTYSWSPAAGLSNGVVLNPKASPLITTQYLLSAVDASGCFFDDSVTVSISSAANISVLDTTKIICGGTATGGFRVAATGATAPYDYFWLPAGVNDSVVSDISAGDHTIIVTDGQGCDTSIVLTLTEPLSLNGTITDSTKATCGQSNGSATVNVAGGTPPYTYSWTSTSGTTSTESNLPGGLHHVVYSDAQGCSDSVSVAIEDATGPSVSVIGQDATCTVPCDGSADATITGGTAPYTYLWDDILSQTTEDAVNLCGGVYKLQVTDALGCIGVGVVSIAEEKKSRLTGQITIGGKPALGGDVKLYKKIDSTGAFPAVDSVLVNAQGVYNFYDLQGGEFIILARPDTTKFPNAVETYADSTHRWDSARVFVLACDTVGMVNIDLIDLTPQGGTVSIKGTVLELGPGKTDKAEGDPIPDVDITLEQVPGGVIKQKSKTDAGGKYQFNNVPVGEYEIHVDIPGLPMDSTYDLDVIVTDSVVEDLDFVVTDSTVTIVDSTVSIHPGLLNHTFDVSVFPNPTRGDLTVGLDLDQNSKVEITMYDALGNKVSRVYSGQIIKGSYRLKFPDFHKEMSTGVYYLNVVAGNQVVVKRVTFIE